MSEPAPEPALAPGEKVLERIRASRATYIREHVMLAALGSVGGAGVLIYIGNPYPWTGVVGALAAIAVRGFYLASDHLSTEWLLTNRRLIGPEGRVVPLSSVKTVRSLFTAVQVITESGDKHMLKYLPDTAATVAQIQHAKARSAQ